MKKEKFGLGSVVEEVKTPETLEQGPGLANVENKEHDPFAKGRERIVAVGEFFNNAKDKTKSLFNKAGGALSRFGSRAKNFAKDALAATLSADVLAKQGYETVKEKVGEKRDQLREFVGSKHEQARNFFSTKAEQVKNFTHSKVELVKDVADFAVSKTKEGSEKVRNGVESRYNRLVSFAEGAVASAKERAARAKEDYRNKVNAARLNRIQEEYNRVNAEQKFLLDQAKSLEQRKSDLAEKMNLLSLVESVA